MIVFLAVFCPHLRFRLILSYEFLFPNETLSPTLLSRCSFVKRVCLRENPPPLDWLSFSFIPFFYQSQRVVCPVSYPLSRSVCPIRNLVPVGTNPILSGVKKIFRLSPGPPPRMRLLPPRQTFGALPLSRSLCNHGSDLQYLPIFRGRGRFLRVRAFSQRLSLPRDKRVAPSSPYRRFSSNFFFFSTLFPRDTSWFNPHGAFAPDLVNITP